MASNLPLNKKGAKILDKMQDFYGKRKGRQVFINMVTEGKITDVESKKKVVIKPKK